MPPDVTRVALALSILGFAVAADAAKTPEPSSLTLTGPSVVILRASAAEVAKAPRDEEFADFRKDFDTQTSRVVTALKAHPAIKVYVSSADVIRFSDPGVPPVWRYSVGSGHGYVLYQPGAPLRVYSGVRTADGILCEAARMFSLKPRPPNCES